MRFPLICFLVSCLAVGGCNPRDLPGIRNLREASEKASTKRAEEAIRNSPELQRLNQVCEEIPLPGRFEFVWKGGPDPETLMLSNYYYSEIDFNTANGEWETYFSKTGWNVVQRDWNVVGKGNRYRKPGYEVVIEFGSMGKRVNYAISCKVLPVS